MEKELAKAFEDVTTNNVKTVIAYSTETRKIVRDLEVRLLAMQDIILDQNKIIDGLKEQLTNIQKVVYSKGT